MEFFKKKIGLLAGITFLIVSCSTEAYAPNLMVTGESGYTFIQSYKQWEKLKRKHQNSYQYKITDLSFSGFGSETLLTIQNGEVVRRAYQSFLMSENDGTRELIEEYEEVGEDIGTHKEGAKAVTLDELYEDCGSEYLMVDPDTHTLYFDTDEEGVMKLCGNVPDLCGDDCFEGFHISMFKWM